MKAFDSPAESTQDIEMNRVGKNGFRTPATKKAKKEEARVSYFHKHLRGLPYFDVRLLSRVG